MQNRSTEKWHLMRNRNPYKVFVGESLGKSPIDDYLSGSLINEGENKGRKKTLIKGGNMSKGTKMRNCVLNMMNNK